MRSTHGIERSEIQELDLIHLTAKKHTAVVSVSPFVTLYNIGGHCIYITPGGNMRSASADGSATVVVEHNKPSTRAASRSEGTVQWCPGNMSARSIHGTTAWQ